MPGMGVDIMLLLIDHPMLSMLMADTVAADLFSSIDDIFRIVQPSSTGTADNRMMTWWGVGYPNGTVLLNRLTQSNSTEQQPSGTRIKL